jgi:hypothetical protein
MTNAGGAADIVAGSTAAAAGAVRWRVIADASSTRCTVHVTAGIGRQARNDLVEVGRARIVLQLRRRSANVGIAGLRTARKECGRGAKAKGLNFGAAAGSTFRRADSRQAADKFGIDGAVEGCGCRSLVGKARDARLGAGGNVGAVTAAAAHGTVAGEEALCHVAELGLTGGLRRCRKRTDNEKEQGDDEKRQQRHVSDSL